ncbi:hypothetical protein NW755_009434 [Fusarium falciforme]|uniref:beta-galactosidase n=1 Tax=Fusarium falciforme TaxID=195108 RepID=A0A9W8UZE9_9HYPO|nr:hypothetical protein NW755_009434 [Fusarium falciforme]
MSDVQVHPKSLPDWNNIEVIHRNTLPPRSNFYLYNTETDALTRDVTKAKALCLSGTWKFNLSKSPFEGPDKFHDRNFDASEFSDIQVPGMWQLQGHGKGPHYTNVDYPFPVDPPNVPFADNECGRYITTFALDDSFKDHQLRLRFEGVDSSFSLWINGTYIGYSQGSRNPSEFDVTELVDIDGKNVLAVEVYQWCDGSYLEDQDQWWLSGIFRDVYLHAFPKTHLNDFQVATELDGKFEDATLRVHVELSGSSAVELKLLDHEGGRVLRDTKNISGKDTFELQVKGPKKWTAETPYLYTLVLNIGEKSSVAHRIGFRTAGLIKGVFCVNGQPIKIRGANRHEHHPDHGRAVPYEFMKQDLLIMKRHNLNAIRTCHQPSDPRLYDLADELGFWVLDEADLECHGFWSTGGDPASFTSDNPVWEDQYVDRARQMVARDKNHACVFMWSLGNEAFYGRNHKAMYKCIKEMDSTRLVHYEQDYEAETVDIYSRMYSSVDEIVEKFAEAEEWTKPLVLCEFIHAMGNGPGNIKEYIEAFYKYPRLMGGWVWEWANHGLRTKTEEGEEYMAYGGDFGDEPNDYNFIMDGVLFSNHTPTPGLIEYAKAVEPVQTLSLDGNKVTIVNRYDYIGLEHLKATWKIVADGKTVPGKEIEIPSGIEPHTQATLTLDGYDESLLSDITGEAYLHLSFVIREDTNWAKAGHQVAFGQLQTSKPESIAALRSLGSGTPTVEQVSPSLLVVRSSTGGSTWDINLAAGALTSWTRSGVELLTTPITMDFYRALTDNDRGGHGKEWQERRLHQTSHHVRQVQWHTDSNTVQVQVTGRIAPPVLAWAVDVVTTYGFHGDALRIHVHGKPHGLRLPETFARIGITVGLDGISDVKWWGRGPGESYVDKKLSQGFGNWSASVDDLWVDYEFPQDGGNRTDVRWVEFVGSQGRVLRARFGDLEGASFSAMPYTTRDVDESTHPYELRKKKKREDTIVRLDWKHHGLGTASCGPATLPEYQLRTDKEFDFEILLD